MKRFDYDLIPDYMMLSMKEYIEEGRLFGGFLESIFSNDLFGAVGSADDQNVSIIPIYVTWIYNHAPMGCHGSLEIVKAWIKQGGLNGK